MALWKFNDTINATGLTACSTNAELDAYGTNPSNHIGLTGEVTIGEEHIIFADNHVLIPYLTTGELGEEMGVGVYDTTASVEIVHGLYISNAQDTSDCLSGLTLEITTVGENVRAWLEANATLVESSTFATRAASDSMQIFLDSPNGIRLYTEGKLCKRNIDIIPTFTGSAGGGISGTYKFNDTIVSTGAFYIEAVADEYMPANIDKLIKVKIIQEGASDDPLYMYPNLLGEWFVVYGCFESNGSSTELYKYVDSVEINQLSGVTVEVLSVGEYTEWFLANTTPVSGGECTKPHVIEVDTLPTENIDENAVYFCDGKYCKGNGAFYDIILCYTEGFTISMADSAAEQGMAFGCFTIPTKTTEGILASSDTEMYAYYIVDENDIFAYQDGAWVALSQDGSLQFGGLINDISEATTAATYYGLGGGWEEYAHAYGALTVTENGEYDVADKSKVVVDIPATPTTYIVESVADLPRTDVEYTSMAIVLMGE